ncbi:MAG: exonuclease domain-containing protein [Ktedonobacteraceae bacterium]
MAMKPPIRVALDLETTGLSAEQDAILEIAAIKFQGATILDKMETLISPGRSIPFRVQRLTGITPKHVSDAPNFESISRSLQQFLGDYPIVGHSIPFDVGFLRRRGLVRTNPLIDTFELATVLLPSLPSYNLGQVAKALDVQLVPGRHRAMVDTLLAMEVFLALHQRLQSIDLLLLKDLANLDAPRTWPLLSFFRQELRDRMVMDGLQKAPFRGSLGDRFAAQLGMDPRVLAFAVAKQGEREQELEAPVSLRIPDLDSQTEQTPSSILAASVNVPISDNLDKLVEIVPEEVMPSSGTVLLSDEISQEEASLPDLASVEKPASEELKEQDRQLQHPHMHFGYQTAFKAVRQALEDRKSLLVEVTIGADDYTPVILPALEWLCEAPTAQGIPPASRRLVIACANQQGARRLVEQVLPRLQTYLRDQLSVAYLAERDGYLCAHRWFGSALRRTSGELSSEQARGLAKLALWAQQTLTGERSELTLLPQEISAWERISSGVERVPLAGDKSETPYQKCLYQRKGYCFVSRAEKRVKAANIVVTTHAGLFDDLSSSHSLLREIDHRLILDADLLEEESARWSSSELDHNRLIRWLNTIGVELSDGRYQGLLALAAPSLRENGPGGLSATQTIAKSELDTRMLSWFQSLRHACAAVDNFFISLGNLLQEGVNSGARDKGKGESSGRGYGGRNNERVDQPLRLTRQLRNVATWLEVEHAWKLVDQRLQGVIEHIKLAETIMLALQRGRHKHDPGSGEDQSLAWELAALAQRLQDQKQLGQRAFMVDITGNSASNNDGEMVYWLRVPPTAQPFVQQRQHDTSASQTSSRNSPVLYAQHIHTASLLKQYILAPNTSAIFAGVALSVDHNFTFYRGRLGLEADVCPALSIVTEHHEQSLLYLPNDIPEPNTPQYQRHLDDAIVQLASMLDGQLVVLFTSHASLKSSYGAVKPLLEARGILALGHGIDGSPRQLWQMFQNQDRVVLLGTGSFWDGSDEISRTPACILLARLPMPVLNDPPIAARAEHYSDQLHQVTVPMAALRVRRALNRLAWSSTRRNAVVLFDRRVSSKEYGATILHTLPQCSQRQGAVSHMPEIILDWLTATGSWD